MDNNNNFVVQYAGFGTRLLAWLLDSIIVSVAISIITGVLAWIPILGWIAAGAINVVGSWFYFALMESTTGQTFGKRIMGIKVVNEQGGLISFGRASGRYFAKYLSALIIFIGYIMAAFTQNKQALHDLLAETYVVTTQNQPFPPFKDYFKVFIG